MRNQFGTIRHLLVAAAFSLCFASVAVAQTVTGTLQGIVTDSTGAVLPGADVVLKNADTGQERTLRTNSDGFYVASFIPIGRYSVTVAQKGFTSIVKDNIEVGLNQTRVVDVTMNPTGVTEAVTVVSQEAPINTTNSEIKGSLNTQEILDKPTANQGSFLTLAETFTGFSENPTSGQNNPTASSGSSVNFNGTGTRGATFQINGVNNDDSSENQHRQGASLSTIKEFQVITNNFTAEFGRGYGAVVLVQTKSGTNSLHGDVYWYHNDSALNAANNVFAPGVKKGVTRRNQFGFTSGFPVIRNKLFGFVSLDHTENTGANNYNRDVFTVAERNPANWFLQTPANNTPGNRAVIQATIDRFRNAVPNDPLAGPRVFRGVQPFDFPARDYSGRFDWNPREEDNFTGRWQYTRQRFAADEIIIGERADQNHKQQNLGLTYTHLFTTRTVGEFRYGLGLRTTLVNIAAGNDTPIIRFFNPSPITTQSSIGSAGNFPIQRYQTDHQFVYNVTTLFGDHYFKAGTDIRRQNLDDLADNFSRGFYNSVTNGICNGINYVTGFNHFLNGCTQNYQKGFGPFFLENRINEANFYAEDNWKIRENLTLNLGLRYEFVNAPREARGRINYIFGNDTDNIEPRVGFAWSPRFESGFLGRVFGGPGDSSIRGGYGIYHGRLFQSVFSQGGATVRFNPPNAILYNETVASARFNPNNLADPTNGFVFVPGVQTARHTITDIDPGLEMPYTQQWNLSVERQMPFKSALRVSYTGNRGIGLLRYASYNLPVHDAANGVRVANHPNNAPDVLYTLSGFGATDPRRTDVRGQVLRPAADILCAGTGLNGVATNAQCPNNVTLGPLEYSFRVPRTNERRPNGLYGTNLAITGSSWSYYHALQIEWTKRLSANLNFQANYTYSKAMDTTSEATAVGAGDSNINTNTARDVRALSRFHTPSRF
ncbi:MAG TPA: TonB-dependent receptor, partial [Pyrinomonadaceae bacterium]|nr:TonB-dependent receptor [Pyrinomonadaceae bacterium]